jgi:nitrite reductase/ring-hydroxylating ferredoxin subunit
MQPTKICKIASVPPGTIRQFNVKDNEILVVNVVGEPSCVGARCTHAGAPLEEGTIEGEVLTCPWHGSQFKVTDGSVVRGPAEKPLKTYKVTIRDGSVFIEL